MAAHILVATVHNNAEARQFPEFRCPDQQTTQSCRREGNHVFAARIVSLTFTGMNSHAERLTL
jgi:hypothetical protein